MQFNDIVPVGMAIGVLAVVMMIMGSVVQMTNETVQDVTTNHSLSDSIFTDLTNALTTFTGFIPVIVISAIGGIAVILLISAFRPQF